MQKLHLHYQEILQGDFDIKPLNCLLVFQVNCPGCFFYALPLFNELYRQFKTDEMGFLALSTAFEDYEFNSRENAKALLEEGVLVGETKKALQQQGIDKLPFSIDFPVGMDKFVDQQAQLDNMIVNICSINPNFDTWPDFDKLGMKRKVADYLNRLDKISMTFTSNQFRGTPTFVLFNDKMEILQSWFGHIDKATIETAIIQNQEIIKKYQKT